MTKKRNNIAKARDTPKKTAAGSGSDGKGKSKTPGNIKENPIKTVAKKLTRGINVRKIAAVFPYIMFGYFGDKLGYAYRITEAEDFFNRLIGALGNLGVAFQNPLPSFNLYDILIGAGIGTGARAVVYFKGKNAKKFRKGEEYGSARWGNEKDIEPYMDHNNFYDNIPLTQTESLMMSSRPKNPKYARNKNILIIGGSGSGKTRFFVKPSLMQLHSSYCVTDPKGTLLVETGKMLKDNGYKIKVINTINFKKSMHYNPFAYIHDEKDILKLVNTLMVNTKGEGAQATEDFWAKAERLLYQAYIGYIFYECIEEDKNFTTLIDMINASETREDDENFKNAIDLLFEDLENTDPEHFAVKQYKKYKLAAGQASKSMFIRPSLFTYRLIRRNRSNVSGR